MEGQEARGQGRYIMKWSALDFCHSPCLTTTVRDFSKRNCERAHAGMTGSRGPGRVTYLLPPPAVPVTLVMKRVRAGIRQGQWESREGAPEIKAKREGNPRGLAVCAL